MIAQIAVGVLVGCLGYAYVAIRPPAPKTCGSPGGPPVTSPRVKLDDGRHLAYKEKGVDKEEAKYKIIIAHGFDDSKDFNLRLSEVSKILLCSRYAAFTECAIQNYRFSLYLLKHELEYNKLEHGR